MTSGMVNPFTYLQSVLAESGGRGIPWEGHEIQLEERVGGGRTTIHVSLHDNGSEGGQVWCYGIDEGGVYYSAPPRDSIIAPGTVNAGEPLTSPEAIQRYCAKRARAIAEFVRRAVEAQRNHTT